MEIWQSRGPNAPKWARYALTVTSFPTDGLSEAASSIVRSLLAQFEERVSERGPFPDLQAGRTVQFGDPDTAMPGRVDLLVLNMDSGTDPAFNELRFVSVRVRRAIHGGFASLSCLHGRKAELRKQLEDLADDPAFLVERIEELAHGLPEETNPDLWK